MSANYSTQPQGVKANDTSYRAFFFSTTSAPQHYLLATCLLQGAKSENIWHI